MQIRPGMASSLWSRRLLPAAAKLDGDGGGGPGWLGLGAVAEPSDFSARCGTKEMR